MHSSTRAFSLMELIVALGLGLILLMVIGSTLSDAAKAVNQTTAQVSLHTRGRAIMAALLDDLESLHPDGEIDVNTDSITLPVCARSLDIDYDGSPDLANDLVWVTYSLQNVPTTTDKGLFRAMDREEDNEWGDIDTAVDERLIDYNTTEIAFFFDDATPGTGTYSSRSTVRPWPSCIRIEIKVKDPASGLQRLFSTSAYVPKL